MKVLFTVRHGDYGGSSLSPLSEVGQKQMDNLNKVVTGLIAKTFGDDKVTRVCFSFSAYPRAIESILKLRMPDEDIVVSGLYMTDRKEIHNPQEIFDKVKSVADFYDAEVAIVVAHGDMPSVLTEAAYEFATDKVSPILPSVGYAQGYAINMSTGNVVPIGWNSLSEENHPQPAGTESSRPVFKGGPRRGNGPIKKGGPNDLGSPL